MLRVKLLKGSTQRISNYYLNEEKHLGIDDKVTMSIDSAKQMSMHFDGDIDNSLSIDKISQYVLAESGCLKNEWYGSLANELGLTQKPLLQADLTAALEGSINGVHVQRRTDGTRRPGYDFMVSMPKGMSIMACVFGDKRIDDLHVKSVKKMLDVASDMIVAYRTKNQDTGAVDHVKTNNVMYALIHHATSRALDPQRHTHVIFPNMAVVDGKARAVNIDTMYDYDLYLYLGHIYQAEMNKGAQELGYNTHKIPVEGKQNEFMYDISDIPSQVIQKFSKRREQLLEAAKEYGLPATSSKDIAALVSRDPKNYQSMSKIQTLWENAFRELEKNNVFNGHNLLSTALQNVSEQSQYNSEQNNYDHTHKHNSESKEKTQPNDIIQSIGNTADNNIASTLIDNTIEHFAKFQTKIDYHDVLNKALFEFLPESKESSISFSQLKSALDQKIKSGLLIPLDKDATKFTTKSMIESEKQLIDSLKIRVQGLSTEVKDRHVRACELTLDNEQVVRSVFSSSKQNMVINTRGANYEAIASLIHIGENSGKSVHVLSPNSYQMRDNNQNIKRKSLNLFQWVRNQFKDNHSQMLGKFLHDQKKHNNLSKNDIVVVDQASKLSIETKQQLLNVTQQGKAKVIFINNDHQSGYTAGNALETLALGGVESYNWSKEHIENVDYELVQIDKDEFKSKSFEIDINTNSLIVTSSAKEAESLNLNARNTLVAQGAIDRVGKTYAMKKAVFLSPAQLISSASYKKGYELVITNSLGKRYHYTVHDVSRKDNTLILKNEKGIESKFNPDKSDYKSIFVSTVENIHLAKGDRLINQNSNDFAELKAGMTYRVESSADNYIVLKDSNNDKVTLTPKQLKHTGLKYDYARTLDYVTGKEQRSIVGVFRSYALKKENFEALQNKLGKQDNLTIYTDDVTTLEKSLLRSSIKSSAIHSVLDASNESSQVTKQLNQSGIDQLKGNLSHAIDKLNVSYNKDVLTKSLDHAIELLSDRETAFTENELFQEALSYAQSNHNIALTYDDLIKAMKAHDELIQGVNPTLWTTKQAVETEKYVLSTLKNGKGKVAPLLTDKQILSSLNDDKNKHLTQGQRNAISLIATTKDRYVQINGYAGVGKSTMLEVLQESVVNHIKSMANDHQEPIEFVGLAPTNSAVKALQEKNINAQTLQSFLYAHKDKKDSDLSNVVLLIDESSMISNKDFKLLTEIVEQKHARVSFIGDVLQQESPSSGAMLRLIDHCKTLDKVTIDDIVRQQDEKSLEAVKHLYKGDIERSNDAFNDQASINTIEYRDETKKAREIKTNIVEINDIDQMLKAIANEYLSRTDECRNDTLIIVNSHNERETITNAIRHGLKAENTLKEQVVIDRLINKNMQPSQMKNMSIYKENQVFQLGNHYYRIEKVDEKNKNIELSSLEKIEKNKENKKIITPENMNHQFNGLFDSIKSDIAVNDKIMIKTSDKSLGIMAKDTFEVKSVMPNGAFVIDVKGKEITIHPEDMKNKLWDYAYTTTTLSAQGLTYKFSIIA
ncbi:MAG: relaxase domain-containing protein, partial [Proteobacteria bacterium]|nr:relaxase domain-containing protein [Pseudomonadota bacterium]